VIPCSCLSAPRTCVRPYQNISCDMFALFVQCPLRVRTIENGITNFLRMNDELWTKLSKAEVYLSGLSGRFQVL